MLSRPRFFYFLFVFAFIMLQSAPLNTLAAETLFQGQPSITKVPVELKSQLDFHLAPPPKVHTLHYISHDLAQNNKVYSRYAIHLVKTKNNFTQYFTQENTGYNYLLRGDGISYGGMFSMLFLKRGDLSRQKNYYIRYQWISISNLKGNLFPLKVGNRMGFDYEAKYQNVEGGPSRIAQGKIIYKVAGKLNSYHYENTTVPGPIYIIKFSKSITPNGPIMLQNIYYFPVKLGWYVYASYYFGGSPLAKYYLTDWS